MNSKIDLTTFVETLNGKMNLKVNAAYKHFEKEIESLFYNFNSKGTLIGNGERNKIKIFNTRVHIINIKSFKCPTIINQVAYKYFRKSKAKRSFENAVYLLSKNVGTPEPIAYAEIFSILGLKDSYYASKHLDYDLTFRELVNNPDFPERELILSEFTKFTYLLHENGILFKDHSPGNTLIKKENGIYNFFLVDLNRMVFKTLTMEERVKNFSRLTPRKEMVEKMSKSYAELTGENFSGIFELMWKETELFQTKYHRKKRLKNFFYLKKI